MPVTKRSKPDTDSDSKEEEIHTSTSVILVTIYGGPDDASTIILNESDSLAIQIMDVVERNISHWTKELIENVRGLHGDITRKTTDAFNGSIHIKKHVYLDAEDDE